MWHMGHQPSVRRASSVCCARMESNGRPTTGVRLSDNSVPVLLVTVVVLFVSECWLATGGVCEKGTEGTEVTFDLKKIV